CARDGGSYFYGLDSW
nr:immunoglobulin heavy chain junction region [Macaca mulatta]MPN84134.1 immunoglobulin heavy chain junction region [Macaca mulatta]MPN84212.1 immunoglobulin heavy chain junction region [Macaca mulatta]MPN84519.1 immunoglobulin heavy chain junction region [Macaca mulatta]MPN84594.1 immunoglobulin heavy chain junction region [Macaca mulatta]